MITLGSLQEHTGKIDEVQLKLNQLRKTLKEEFFGIDYIIDNILNLIEPWMLIPDGQIKPIVINLWGMTGTGKTSLVRRIAEVLEYRLLQFNLGDEINSNFSSRYSNLLYQFTDMQKQPVVILLDEIQNCRAINEMGYEIGGLNMQGLWSLLSDGKICGVPNYNLYGFVDKIINSIIYYKIENNLPMSDEEYSIMKDCGLYQCATVTNASNRVSDMPFLGRTSSFADYDTIHRDTLIDAANCILKEYERCINEGANLKYDTHGWAPIEKLDYYLFASSHVRQVYMICSKGIGMELKELRDLLNKDYIKAMYILLRALLSANKQQELDFTQALIFVAGNMDEVYLSAKSTSPDITLEKLYQSTKQITVPKIKQALLKRFRAEQAARLGNNHILYPSFTKEVYYKIIESRLRAISDYYSEKLGVSLDFHREVVELIFKEGVIPTQGARPVLSTISSLVESFIPKAIFDLMAMKKDLPEAICLQVTVRPKEKEYHMVFHFEDVEVSFFKLTLNIESLRRPEYNETSIYTSVHEAGHAICFMMSNGMAPIKLSAFSSSALDLGFMDVASNNGVMSKRDFENQIVILLGGIAAEKCVFGNELISSGAQQDISTATSIALDMIKRLGFGTLPVSKSRRSNTDEHFVDEEQTDIDTVKDIIKECQEVAETLVKKHEKILLDLAVLLLQKSQLTQLDLEEFLKEHNVKLRHLDTAQDKFEDKLRKYGIELSNLKSENVG